MNSNNFFSDQSAIHLQKKFLRTSDNFRKAIFYLKADIPLPDKDLKKRLQKKEEFKKTIKQIFKHVFNNDKVIITNTNDSTLHAVYNVTFQNKKYVIKINKFSELYHETQFLQEYWINNLLQQNSLPLVEIPSVDISKRNFPFDFMIMRQANGKILHDRKLSNKKEKEIFSNIGASIAKIHSFKTTNFGPFSMVKMIKTGNGVGLYQSWENFFTLNLSAHITTCLNNKAISSSEKMHIEKIFSDNRNLLRNSTPSIVHNDLSSRNMFVDDNNLTTLVDWEDAISGDPVYDIASFGTFCYLPKHGHRITYFLDGYKQIKKLPEDFEKRYWLYYLRVAILKTALLVRQGKVKNDARSLRIQRAIKALS